MPFASRLASQWIDSLPHVPVVFSCSLHCKIGKFLCHIAASYPKVYSATVLDHPPFQIHLEPENPIELPDLLRCLGAINHQFEVFATAEGLSSARDAKLLVSSVKPGSIDIGLLPDITTLGTLVAPVMVYSAPVLKFLTALKGLLDKFKSKTPAESVTIRDCSDAIAIAAPIAKSGGSQTFNSFNGEFYKPVFVLDQGVSRDLIANAYATKALLEGEASEMRQRVPLVWHGLDTDQARSGGKRNPDKAVIEELMKSRGQYSSRMSLSA